MSFPEIPADQSPEWSSLQSAAARIRHRIRDDGALRHCDPAAVLAIEELGIELDGTRQWLDAAALDSLHAFARAQQLEARRDALLGGALVNHSERRAALHGALRSPKTASIVSGGQDVVPLVHATLARMRELADALHAGRLTGAGGTPITDIVNIGIGGSDLGPRLVCDALQDEAPDHLRVHFLSNVDGTGAARLMRKLRPAATLFIVSSKSFATRETRLNAKTLFAWCLASGLSASELQAQVFAVTARPAAAEEFGIAADNILPLWDWVGGRFSVWSAIGLPVALQLGYRKFEEMLAGAAAMDQHFAKAELEQNLPMRMALLAIWNGTVLNMPSHCAVAYDDRLRLFVDWLQQLEMESNGKGRTASGERLAYATSQVVWGGLGTNDQHAYFQLLREGTRETSIDLLCVQQPSHACAEHHVALLANARAQADALADRVGGRAGGNAVSVLSMKKFDPHMLGMLLSAFEHRTAMIGAALGINSFDQPGVELGKQMAAALEQA